MRGAQTDRDHEKRGGWTFLTNHAHVLLCLTRSSSPRIRDIAKEIGITDRAVQHVIADLVSAGYIDRRKEGRRNVYHVHRDRALRHPIEAHRTISGLISFVYGTEK